MRFPPCFHSGAARVGAVFTVLSVATAMHAAELRIALNEGSPRVDFGLRQLEQALGEKGHTLHRTALGEWPAARIVVRVGEARIQPVATAHWLEGLTGPEDFRLVRSGPIDGAPLVVAALTDRGAMYGLIETADGIRRFGSVERIPETVARARLPFRAIKFNLPWMSYRRGPSLQVHAETCRDLEFWERFLDMMAVNRFNALSLWNLHPFPYLIRPRNFPEACPFDDVELADWQDFWRTLFRLAADRGIETYLVNWNIFVSPGFARAHGAAEYSIDWNYFSDGDTSELVERYTRECVTQVIDEYDDLTGLGVTLGEGMGGMTPAERRDWIERTFIAGIRSASRPARFIYRAPLSAGTASGGSVSRSVEKLTRAAIESLDFPDPVLVEFKYNWSHGHSSPRLHIVHGGPLTDAYWNPPPTNYQVIWTVRNEDFFVLRWGEPDFIREFIANNTPPWVGGCFIGSECAIPATDSFTPDGAPRDWDYAFERQWLFYRLWGRLLYDPATPDALFAADLERRHGTGLGEPLLAAWRLASRTPLRLATFFGSTWDGTLYSEGFLTAKPGGAGQFIDIDTFISRRPLDPQYAGIVEFVKANEHLPAGRIPPTRLAAELSADADRVLEIVGTVGNEPGPRSPSLAAELADLEAWAWMARYLAAKIHGGIALERFRTHGASADRQAAIAALEAGVCHWRKLVDTIARHNRRTIPYIFDEEFSWWKHLASTQQDVQTARTARKRE